MRIIFIVIVIFCVVSNCYSAKILGLFPAQIKSHFVMFEALMKGLAERGHEVDVLSHFPQVKSIPRYNDLNVRGTLPIYVNNLTTTTANIIRTSLGGMEFVFKKFGSDLCDAMFKAPIVQHLYNNMNNETYDLIITEIFGTDCMLIFAYKFHAPVIGITSASSIPWMYDRFGDIDNPSFVSTIWPTSNRMNLMERVINTIILVASKLSYHYFSTLKAEQKLKTTFGDNVPSIYDLQNNMSLLFTNSHFSINDARPISPNVIEVGGLHINPIQKLPLNIEQKLNESKEGVIVFSLGSMIRTETFSEDKQKALIEAFSKLPYTVYWKVGRESVPGLIPNNIIFGTWLPQLEILCHPNTKLFITHGGLMGTQEAIYCGVPMIGIPFFGDQEYNIHNYQKKGIAIKLPYAEITKENVLKAVTTIISDSSYKKNCELISKRFRDRPHSPLATAIYWTEYVIRHKGSLHMRPSNFYLSWYQYYLLDVFCIIICIVLVISVIIYFIIKLLLRNVQNVLIKPKML